MWLDALRALVADAGLNGGKLAADIKMSPQAAYHWLSGAKLPGWAAMLRICDLLEPEHELELWRLRAQAAARDDLAAPLAA